jgi:hypothetical protein
MFYVKHILKMKNRRDKQKVHQIFDYFKYLTAVV